jgi:hypothetical protein
MIPSCLDNVDETPGTSQRRIYASLLSTIVVAPVSVGLVSVVALLGATALIKDDAISAKRHLASVGAGVVIDLILIVASLDALSNEAVAAICW